MKKTVCALLCILMLLAAFPAVAHADSSYSTVSDKGVALEYPNPYRGIELRAYVKAARGQYIYIMPRPKAGNGHLGTVDHGTEVTILGETGDYYFFRTADGREGWNGKKYFTVLGRAVTSYFPEEETVYFLSGGSVVIPASFERQMQKTFDNGAAHWYCYGDPDSGKMLYLIEYSLEDYDYSGKEWMDSRYESLRPEFFGDVWIDGLGDDGFEIQGQRSPAEDVTTTIHCWLTDSTLYLLELDYANWDLDGSWVADMIFESRCY